MYALAAHNMGFATPYFFAATTGKIEMRLFVLYNLQLEIINFLHKNLRKAECYTHREKTSFLTNIFLLKFI